MSTKLTNDCRLFKLPGGKSYTRERACTNLHYYTVFLQSDWSILLKYKLRNINDALRGDVNNNIIIEFRWNISMYAMLPEPIPEK